MRAWILPTALLVVLVLAGAARAQNAGPNGQGIIIPGPLQQAFPNGIQTQDDLMKFEMMRRALNRRRGPVATGNPALAVPQGYGQPPVVPGIGNAQPRGLSRGSGRRSAPVDAQELAEKKKEEKKKAAEERKAALEEKKAAAKK